MAQADYNYWTDPNQVPKDFKVFLETATKNLPPNRDRMVFIKDGQEFLPGITAISAPGRRPQLPRSPSSSTAAGR